MIPVSVAPMMDWTDRHYRYFARCFTRRTLLYTEMITAAAIIHGDREKLLGFDPVEHPVSLQLGGDDPEQLHRAVEIAEAWGYDEYNLNAGCPSDRVQDGNFGACLMADPDRVAHLVGAMRSATDRPVTVKHRIGIDGRESYREMRAFVDTVAATGVTRFTVHARIAILQGLSPKQNRSVPPVRYDDVYRLKRERPHLEIEINGEIKTLADIHRHLEHVDAVMIGRAAYANPVLLAGLDRAVFGDRPGGGATQEEPIREGPVREEPGQEKPAREEPAQEVLTREGVVRKMIPYLERVVAEGTPPRRVTNHMLGLFSGRPGARHWKRSLSGRLPDKPAAALLEDALRAVPETVRREPVGRDL